MLLLLFIYNLDQRFQPVVEAVSVFVNKEFFGRVVARGGASMVTAAESFLPHKLTVSLCCYVIISPTNQRSPITEATPTLPSPGSGPGRNDGLVRVSSGNALGLDLV